MENFTMNDIHSGYVIELRNGERLLAMHVNQNNFTKIFVYEQINQWYYASCWDNNTLEYKHRPNDGNSEDYDIVKVYGLISVSHNYEMANTTDLDGRKLLWQRPERIKIRMSDIRKLIHANDDVEILIEVDDV